MSLVSFESVCKNYGGKTALSDFTLSMNAASRVVLFGPSGCGKTTVVRLIAGLIEPDAGAISIAGIVVATGGRNVVESEQRNIGMVFQDLALWPHMTVWENIEFGLRAQRVPPVGRLRRIEEVLELIQLAAHAKAKPAELSGGQQQRVAIARALVLRPQVLLMDEPLANLDDAIKERLIAEILELQAARQFTLVYVTHDRDEAKAIGETTVSMHGGKITSVQSVTVP